MLKLEKASQRGTITVTVRNKDSRFTPSLYLAFGIALAIHLSLIVLFHIAPFKIEINTIFPPTRVEVDPPVKESAIAIIAPSKQTIKGLPALPKSSPILSKHPTFLAVRPEEYGKIENTIKTTFEKIEKEIYQPVFNPIAQRPKEPLKILISGLLADQALISSGLEISNGLDEKFLPIFHASQTTEVRVIYSVIVEGRTGKIFWFEPKQLTQIPSINSFAEALLRNMKFETKSHLMTLNGEIELHFYLGIK